MRHDGVSLSRIVAVILSLALLTSLLVLPASAAYSTSSPAAGKVVTERDPLNVRAGAGTNYRVVSQADKGSYLQVIGNSGSFYKVVYNSAGKTGYVSKTYLKIVSTGTAKVTTQRDPLVLRKTASTSGKNLAQIPKGTMVPILKKSGNWYQVVYRNQIGYCSATYLTVSGKTPEAKTTITFNDISNPGTITKGNGVHLSGTIKSTNSKLSSITASIQNASGKSVMSKTVKPNAYSYKIYNSDLDWAMAFGSLNVGSYTLRYDAKTADGTTRSTSKKFTVKAAGQSAPPSESSGILASARSYLGKTGSQLGYSSDWCTYFVSNIIQKNGYSSVPTAGTPRDLVKNVLNKGKGKYYSFRDANYNSLVSAGLTRTDLVSRTSRSAVTPKAGDIVVFLWSYDVGQYNWSHIGFVSSYGGGILKTIEGNTGGGNSCLTRVVAEQNRSYNSTVVGILRLT